MTGSDSWRHQAWIVAAATVLWSIIDEWNNSGHVKSRLWEFHQSDKQSGCVYYYMEGGKGLFQAIVWDCPVHPLLWIWGWLAVIHNSGGHLPLRLKVLHVKGQVCLHGIIVDTWSHAFGNFTKVTNKVAVFTTTWEGGKRDFFRLVIN
jgi:hypothetical protein